MSPIIRLFLRMPGAFFKFAQLFFASVVVVSVASVLDPYYAQGWNGPVAHIVSSFQASTADFRLFGVRFDRFLFDCALAAIASLLLLNLIYLEKYKTSWFQFSIWAFRNLTDKDSKTPEDTDLPTAPAPVKAFSAAMVLTGLGMFLVQFWEQTQSNDTIAEVEAVKQFGVGVGYWYREMMEIREFRALYDFRAMFSRVSQGDWYSVGIVSAGLLGFAYFCTLVISEGERWPTSARKVALAVMGLALLYFLPLLLWFAIGLLLMGLILGAGILLLPLGVVGFVFFPLFCLFFLTSWLMEWRWASGLLTVLTALLVYDLVWLELSQR